MSIRHSSEEDVDGIYVAISDVPDAPVTASAVDVGTSRALNNGAATVSFSAAATGGTPTSYTATSTPGSFTSTGTTSPLTVTGLQSGTAYTFGVTATNGTGTSPAKTTTGITATSVPGAPGTPTATVTNTSTVSLAFTAGATGGKTITSYTATSSPSVSLTATGTSSPVSVSGVFNPATSYTFYLTAVNANGSSVTSSASNSVTPRTTYAIGDTGPGGGIVFYDAGSTLSWGRYLEAAVNTTSPSWTVSSVPWIGSGSTTTTNGNTNTAIGTGMANTLAMVAQNATAGCAATVCRSYAGGGYTSTTTGWFLPSKDDFNALVAQGTAFSGLTTNPYWSSSEYTYRYSWFQFGDGSGQSVTTKSSSEYVRAIRAF